MAARKTGERPERDAKRSGRQATRAGSTGEAAGSERPRKDRLIQTRVPRDLEATLKEEARRRRLTVSHLIRNVLEDTFQLVDGVVSNVDQIVTDSVALARGIGREAKRWSGPKADRGPVARARGDERLDHVVAWSEVVVHRSVACSQCGAPIARGARAYTGISDEPGAQRAWLCTRCIDSLSRA